jgi:hypothetical protein
MVRSPRDSYRILMLSSVALAGEAGRDDTTPRGTIICAK